MPTTTQITTTMISARPVPTDAAQNEGPATFPELTTTPDVSSHLIFEKNKLLLVFLGVRGWVTFRVYSRAHHEAALPRALIHREVGLCCSKLEICLILMETGGMGQFWFCPLRCKCSRVYKCSMPAPAQIVL